MVASGYVRLLDPIADGVQFIRLILGRGGLFGDLPFGTSAFPGFASPQQEQATAHGPAEVLEMDRLELEAAARPGRPRDPAARIGDDPRAVPRTPAALAVQDANPGASGHHHPRPDLLPGPALPPRPYGGCPTDAPGPFGVGRRGTTRGQPRSCVRLRDEGLVSYTRSYFCVEDLSGLSRIAAGEADFAESSSG